MWCISAGADGESAGLLWLDLGSRYCEPHRHYHTLDHIGASLAHLDGVGVNPIVEGAIWFHDAIYDPTRDDNELRSAEYFLEVTKDWIDPARAENIQRLILATDFRTESGDDPDVHLMLDIDLAVLSAPATDYDGYRDAIRREYGHVPDEDFRKGRAAVVRRFLEKPIYRTAAYQLRETVARENILRELAILGG